MKYKVIDNKRLNVYLTKNDLQKENVTIDDIVDGSESSVIKIKKIFKTISELAQFNINNKMLNIVLMPVVDGDLIISAGIADSESTAKKTGVFVFDDFENLLDACFMIKRYKILSSLYFMKEKFYFFVEYVEFCEKYFENLCKMLTEYGDKTDISSLFLSEHGKIIIKNHAKEVLIKKFF